MAITDFNEVAEIYDDNLNELLGKYIKGSTEKYAEYKIQLVHSIIKKINPKSILDFGCGTGRSLEYIEKYFPSSELFGCDVSEDELTIARRNFPKAEYFNNSDVNTFSSDSKKFDLIITACVMHHIEPNDREKWVNAVFSRLTNDGYWAVFEHNLINPYTKRIVMDVDNKVDNIEWMYTRKKILNLVKNIKNVNIAWQGYTLFSPFRFTHDKLDKQNKISYFITCFEKSLKWCPLGAQQCVIFKKTGNTL